MPPVRHTFLFQEGFWAARGRFFDSTGQGFPCHGAAWIIHETGTWKNDGRMTVLTEPKSEYINTYQIVPFAPGEGCTTWKSINPALGPLEGTFTVIEDAIFSLWNAGDQEFDGVETMFRQDEDNYLARGFARWRGLVVSSWSVQLSRPRSY